MSTLLRAALIASALYSTPTRAASIRWGSPVVKKSPKRRISEMWRFLMLKLNETVPIGKWWET